MLWISSYTAIITLLEIRNVAQLELQVASIWRQLKHNRTALDIRVTNPKTQPNRNPLVP